jgi:SAM-dependent methyltransferase
VVGLDLSEFMLDKCKTAAASCGVDPVLIHADMREIGFNSEFDAVINMYSSFGYLETADEDQKAINAASLALRGGGLLLIDLMNRDWTMKCFESLAWHENPRGDLILAERYFDSLSGRINSREVTIHCDGRRTENYHSMRLYTFTELQSMLNKSGLEVQFVYGDYESAPFTADSRRMIVVSRKQ